MKNFLLGLTIIVLGVSLWWYWPSNETTAVSVLWDVTDSSIAGPDSESIRKLFHLEDNKWQGADFRYSTITDLSLNEMSEAHIKASFSLLSNEFERTSEVAAFNANVNTILSAGKLRGEGRIHTSAYKPISRELMHLSESAAEKKILVVYSDLMENESDFSLYGKNMLELIEKNPESVKEAFLKEMPLPSLSGITVYFVYTPKSEIQDKEFSILSQLYASMLEAKGANVYIVPNL